MLHSIYDLTTFCRKTGGDVPAKVVGASTTIVGSKMYLFGGRLVTERRMVSDLYVFDLETFAWERIPAFPEDDIPRARYFHSADAWNGHLVVFGGMSTKPDSNNPEELCVLNDVHFYNLSTGHWLPSPPVSPEAVPFIPRARYAHLSSVTADRLFIIGGQDFLNTWQDDICVFDLVSRQWVQRRDYPRHCGTYRSVAVCSDITVRSPVSDLQTATPLGPVGSRFPYNKLPRTDITQSENLIHLPYSVNPTEDDPSDIYLYSNYNFTDVKRELEVFSPLPDADFTIQDRSSSMTGSTFPPGLRFPTGAVLGTHLIIAGTYLAHSYQSFSIWVLDLTTMTWSRIDPGKAIESGSWFRGLLWPDANKFLIFGNQHGNLVDDYNRRLLSWDHVAVVDLEAFGIYKPPPLKLDVRMQELGLAALEESVLTDFEIVCDDGQRIQCSRRVLEERWPWFKEQRKQFLNKAKTTLESLPTSSMHVPMPDMSKDGIIEPRVDPRLTPRAFYLSESYAVTLAFLQYFYSLALITPLQHTPAVLSQLLILATNYRISHLESLVKHAMHRSLSNSTSVGVYEVATLCSCRSLQIRALKTVMSYTQKRPPRRSDKENSGSSSRHQLESQDSGVGVNGDDSTVKHVSRARGTSDAKWRTMTDSGASSSGYNTRGELEYNSEMDLSRQIPTKKSTGSFAGQMQPPREVLLQSSPSRSANRAEHDPNHSNVTHQLSTQFIDPYASRLERSVSGNVAPLRILRADSDLQAQQSAAGPMLAPMPLNVGARGGPPPQRPHLFTTGSSNVRGESYNDDSEFVTTDDEYQERSMRARAATASELNAPRWGGQESRWGSGSEGEYTMPRKQVPPIAPSFANDASAMASPVIKSAASTSSFTRFLSRPKKKPTLEDDASESDSAWATAFANEKKRREKGMTLSEGPTSYATLSAVALYK